jgi:hypothetical protein
VSDAAHRTWVEMDGCPEVHPDDPGIWCNGRGGHGGLHWARRVPTPDKSIGASNPPKIEWR